MTREITRDKSDRRSRPLVTVPSPGAATAREALIAEAIGDVGRLLDRIDPMLRAMEGARKNLADTKVDLDRRLGEFQVQLGQFTEAAKGNIVQHVVRRSNEIAAQSIEHQTQAMRKAARQLFDDEVGPTLRRLTEALRQIVERSQRSGDGVLTHVATALASALVTWSVIFFFQR